MRSMSLQINIKREFGLLKGKVKMSSDFDSKEVNDEISEMFGM
mgnify:CR=1 FL=1